MTLKDARALRDEIREYGYHCTVPLGWGPNGYEAYICGVNGPIGFAARAEFRRYHAMRLRQRRKVTRQGITKPRSPLDAMIDQACGVTAKDYLR